MDIIVDVDGVVADFVTAVDNIVPHKGEVREWHWWNKYSKEESRKINQALTQREFWDNLPVIKDAKEGIQFLRNNGHQIIWVTAPFSHCTEWVDARHKWLEKNFQRSQLEEPIVYTRAKYLIKATAMIDDCVEWVEEWENNWKFEPTVGYTFYSEIDHSPRRKYTWQDIMKEQLFNGSKYKPTT
jgi:5'(3')-deoxyribonucleotidase